MTLDEAIKHAIEIANQLEESAMRLDITAEQAGCYSCAKEHRQLAEWLKELKRFKENSRWIPTAERLPEERINPITKDFYPYQCTFKNGDVYDVRFYKFGQGHWWHGSEIYDGHVIAWRERPEPYKESEG